MDARNVRCGRWKGLENRITVAMEGISLVGAFDFRPEMLKAHGDCAREVFSRSPLDLTRSLIIPGFHRCHYCYVGGYKNKMPAIHGGYSVPIC